MSRRKDSSNVSSNEDLYKINKRQSTVGVRQSIYTGESSRQTTFYASRTDRIKYKVNATTEVDRELHPEFLQRLLQHTWNLCRLSPLRNLSYRPVILKQYAARIKQSLAMNIHDSANNISFNVKVSVFAEIIRNDSDSTSLMIEVTQQRGDNEVKIKYLGMILFWDTESENNMCLPLLLSAGTITVMRIVHQTLQQIFNTVVRPLHISQEDVMWLSVLNAFSIDQRKSKGVVFKYSYQTLRNFIKITLPCSTLHTLWTRVHPPDNEEILFEELEKFYKIINTELHSLFSLNFLKLQLHNIVSPEVTVFCAGKIKFHVEESIIKILDFLTNVSVILHNPCPTMSYRDEP